MATDLRFDDPPTKPLPNQKGSGGNCLMTCLIVAGVLFVLLLIGGGITAWYVSQNWKGWVADAATTALEQAIDEADGLNDGQKTELKQQVKRLGDAFTDGTLPLEKLAEFAEGLTKSPLLPTFIVQAVDKKYLERSGLDEAEKAEGRRALRRFVRGAVQEKFEQSDFDDLMDFVADRNPDGGWELKPQVPDEDLRAFLQAAKEKADAAEIPDEDYEVDPVDEFRKLVDEALGETE